MSDDFVLAAWLCLFAALFFFIFWGAWRAYNLRGFVMYLLMWSCMISAVIFAVNSTTPSSAPRRQSIGIITWIVDHKQGRSHTYTLGFKSDAGQDLTLEAAATPLFFAEKRDKVAITYLEENRSYPRVIRFQALTGPRKGDETAVSADWFGPWLGVIFSAIVGIAAIIGANRNKRSKSQHLQSGGRISPYKSASRKRRSPTSNRNNALTPGGLHFVGSWTLRVYGTNPALTAPQLPPLLSPAPCLALIPALRHQHPRHHNPAPQHDHQRRIHGRTLLPRLTLRIHPTLKTSNHRSHTSSIPLSSVQDEPTTPTITSAIALPYRPQPRPGH